jgi:hypothetical protein
MNYWLSCGKAATLNSSKSGLTGVVIMAMLKENLNCCGDKE